MSKIVFLLAYLYTVFSSENNLRGRYLNFSFWKV